MAGRHSRKTSTDITLSGWLVFDERGGFRLTRDRPGLKPNERIASIELKAPLTLWTTPEFRLNVEVKDNSDPKGAVKHVAAALETYGGFEVTVKAVPTAEVSSAS